MSEEITKKILVNLIQSSKENTQVNINKEASVSYLLKQLKAQRQLFSTDESSIIANILEKLSQEKSIKFQILYKRLMSLNSKLTPSRTSSPKDNSCTSYCSLNASRSDCQFCLYWLSDSPSKAVPILSD